MQTNINTKKCIYNVNQANVGVLVFITSFMKAISSLVFMWVIDTHHDMGCYSYSGISGYGYGNAL